MSDDSDFGRVMRGLASNEILIPTIHAALYSPSFGGFTVQVPPWSDRPYDSKFHPSTHSLWTVRQLYAYLVAYDRLELEHMELTGVFAVTAGSFWHQFLQTILVDSGTFVRQRPDGGPLHPAEVVVDDPETNRTGHADGVMVTGELAELKSINGFQVRKVDSEEALRLKKPEHWAQHQDYLDMLGLESGRFLMLNPDYPFPMKEFVVRASKGHQARRRDEYRQAMELAVLYPDYRELDNPQTRIPFCDGCGPKSAMAKACPARRICPIGKAGT